MIFARWIFWIAGVTGLLMLVPQYFLESRFNAAMPPAISHPEFFYGFLGAVIAWHLMFLLIGWDPYRYRWAMLPAVVEKLSFGLAIVSLFLNRRLAAEMLAPGMMDLALGTLFFAAFCFTAKGKPD